MKGLIILVLSFSFLWKITLAQNDSVVNYNQTKEWLIQQQKAFYPQTFTLKDSVFEVGDVLRCEIHYSYNKHGVLEESYPFLDSLAMLLNKYPNLVIEITSNTDYRGSDKYNQMLSTKRSEMLVWHLHNKEVKEERLKAVGYGENNPIIKKAEIEALKTQVEKELAHRINRRTEFKILGLNFK